MNTISESVRLQETRASSVPWKKWGPYLSERQWGTVREDYSPDGNAWDYFSHDHARSRAYHWGEDGLAGICDDRQQLCFAVALWNGRDPILKERLFGLTNREGNHGEDVKEYYFYLDSTPTHSYMKYLYKYPQAAFPYDDLVRTNKLRSRCQMEYELLDTGIFEGNRYFDVFVEYVKNTPEDVLIQISVCNRGPDAATLHVLPTLWFRNTWSWSSGAAKPVMNAAPGVVGARAIAATHPELGDRFLYCEADVPLLFTENETNNERVFNTPNGSPHVKDGINDHIVLGKKGVINPELTGTKASAHYQVTIEARGMATIWLRLCDQPPALMSEPFGNQFAEIIRTRRREADEYYRAITPDWASEEAARIMRQALAGMLWSKQYFSLDVDKWLEEHGADPMRPCAPHMRNSEWFHMVNESIISTPDKWEYPWYAAWPSAFHAIALSSVDVDFAKEQLELLLQENFLHPTGQIPACEWNFGDVNPPVHAWATIFLYRTEQALHGDGDIDFLKRSFQKLMLNFSWWINRKDRFGRNVFECGFLGLDNIGVFDRSAPLPGGGYLEQADGTAWMALFCQNMMEIAVELASVDSSYEENGDEVPRPFPMDRAGHKPDWAQRHVGRGGWILLRRPAVSRWRRNTFEGALSGGSAAPLCYDDYRAMAEGGVPHATAMYSERVRRMPALLESIHPTGPDHRGVADRGIFALVSPQRLRRILSRMLDENEFLSPYGIRSLSRYHAQHPYGVTVQGHEHRVTYVPAESDSGLFGGNSNWRGPVWMPVNALLIALCCRFTSTTATTLKLSVPPGPVDG